jgi:hypothetical protein
MQGFERADRQLLDAAALAGHLVPAGSMFAFLAAHRAEIFPDADYADLFAPPGVGRAGPATLCPGASGNTVPGSRPLTAATSVPQVPHASTAPRLAGPGSGSSRSPAFTGPAGRCRPGRSHARTACDVSGPAACPLHRQHGRAGPAGAAEWHDTHSRGFSWSGSRWR